MRKLLAVLILAFTVFLYSSGEIYSDPSPNFCEKGYCCPKDKPVRCGQSTCCPSGYSCCGDDCVPPVGFKCCVNPFSPPYSVRYPIDAVCCLDLNSSRTFACPAGTICYRNKDDIYIYTMKKGKCWDMNWNIVSGVDLPSSSEATKGTPMQKFQSGQTPAPTQNLPQSQKPTPGNPPVQKKGH